MADKPEPQSGIMDIDLYVGGHATIAGRDDVVKLSSNENPLGPSPAAIAAYQAASGNLHRYPSTDHLALRTAIGAAHDLDPAQIICGVGSDEIITFLCQAYAGPDDEVVHTEHGFAMYRISALAAGATPVEVVENNRVTDVDAILAGCTDRTKLVFIANPNNPTGTMIGGNEIARLAAGIPKGAILVLDGAYAEFVDGFDGGASLISDYDNVVMTRTFSKLYGLGGLRIGWGYGPQEIIDVLNRIRGPFNLSETQLAAAMAAVQDQDYTDYCRRENAIQRDWMIAQLRSIGIAVDTSHANFVLARFTDAEKAKAADLCLQNHGLIVRGVAGYKLPQCLRITVGDRASCERVVTALTEFMGQKS